MIAKNSGLEERVMHIVLNITISYAEKLQLQGDAKQIKRLILEYYAIKLNTLTTSSAKRKTLISL